MEEEEFDRLLDASSLGAPHVAACMQDGDSEVTVSRRFFWWPVGRLTYRWRPLYWGTEENCNRTLGLRVPGGVLFSCLNIPLRQTPCSECST